MRKAASSLRNSTSQKRSLMMVGMAASVEHRGSSSNVFSIAAKWNMKVLKYEDVLPFMRNSNFVSSYVCSQTVRNKSSHKVRTLRSPFIKVEDHSRKFRPEFAEMVSFPYIDFNTKGTSSPFETWFQENRNHSK